VKDIYNEALASLNIKISQGSLGRVMIRMSDNSTKMEKKILIVNEEGLIPKSEKTFLRGRVSGL
jgi:hypothetical protein